jgi:structural maintenance of chromosome 3 (chondroitin sulfate proteoglycan 6)
MNREKAGRVTFMPLNRLSSTSDVRFPDAEDCLPLIARIRFDPAYKPAVEQVFGRTVVCPDLLIAADYTRSHGVNGITLDGDRADRRGVLTGGYYDVRRSRLDIIKAVKNWTEKYEADAARHEEVTNAITRLDQEITALQGEMQKTEASRRQAADARQPLITKVSWIQREEETLGQRLAELKESLTVAEQDGHDLETKIKAYQTELKSKMTQNLSAAEVKEMSELSARVDKQKAESVEISKKRAEVSGRLAHAS